ncbi:MAG TPA: hypothetical protein VF053_11470 [Streptosporangiales bacterium]
MRDTDQIRSLMSPADPAADVDVSSRVTADELIDRAAEPAATPKPSRRRTAGRRLVWSAVGATAVAAAVIAAVVVPGFGSHGVKPAYAVTKQHDGNVRVDIEALNNVADFKRQMRRAGVPTEVERVPAGMHCKDIGRGYRGLKIIVRTKHSTLDRSRSHKVVVKITSFLITPSEIKKGQTLVLESHGTRVTGFYIAKAPHRCVLVPIR